MPPRLKPLAKKLVARATLSLAPRWSSDRVVGLARRLNKIQLTVAELQAILLAVSAKAPCRFLVFGLGNDTGLWVRANPGGTTVFLEDDPEWMAAVTARHRVTAHLVRYDTRVSEAGGLLNTPAVLDLDLPAEVAAGGWT